jgi:hypothetical protein
MGALLLADAGLGDHAAHDVWVQYRLRGIKHAFPLVFGVRHCAEWNGSGFPVVVVQITFAAL